MSLNNCEILRLVYQSLSCSRCIKQKHLFIVTIMIYYKMRITQKSNEGCLFFQLHMYLLGHTMGVKIQVVQPSALSCNNFVAHYPDEGADSYPKIYLLQEAEGHYDVLST